MEEEGLSPSGCRSNFVEKNTQVRWRFKHFYSHCYCCCQGCISIAALLASNITNQGLVPPTTWQVTTLRYSARDSEWLPLPPSCSQAGLSIKPCRGTKSVKAWLWLQQCRLNFCSQIWCVQVAELSQGVELHHLHRPHLQIPRALQGSQRQPSHSAWSCTNSKNQTPITCHQQIHKHWIKLLTEITLKQVQKNNNQNRLMSYSVWKIQNPRFLGLHGKRMCSPALPVTTIQAELLICLSDSNPLPCFFWGDLGSLTAFPTPTQLLSKFWDTQVWKYLSLFILSLKVFCLLQTLTIQYEDFRL